MVVSNQDYTWCRTSSVARLTISSCRCLSSLVLVCYIPNIWDGWGIRVNLFPALKLILSDLVTFPWIVKLPTHISMRKFRVCQREWYVRRAPNYGKAIHLTISPNKVWQNHVIHLDLSKLDYISHVSHGSTLTFKCFVSIQLFLRQTLFIVVNQEVLVVPMFEILSCSSTFKVFVSFFERQQFDIVVFVFHLSELVRFRFVSLT